jgi:DNA-binding protein HU-beta
MNKADLVTRIAKDADLTKRQSEKVLDVLLESIQIALSRGESVTLVGFGTFSVMARAARKTPKFRAGKGLREVIKALQTFYVKPFMGET